MAWTFFVHSKQKGGEKMEDRKNSKGYRDQTAFEAESRIERKRMGLKQIELECNVPEGFAPNYVKSIREEIEGSKKLKLFVNFRIKELSTSNQERIKICINSHATNKKELIEFIEWLKDYYGATVTHSNVNLG